MDSREPYEKAKQEYERLRSKHPEIIDEIKASIDDYVDSKDTIYSHEAGSKIIPKHDKLKTICGSLASSVFGILMKEHLTSNGWAQDTEVINGRKRTRYDRENDSGYMAN